MRVNFASGTKRNYSIKFFVVIEDFDYDRDMIEDVYSFIDLIKEEIDFKRLGLKFDFDEDGDLFLGNCGEIVYCTLNKK